MRASRRPPTSRGRDRHLLAILIEPDTVGLEVAIALQIFGRRIPPLVERTGDDPESPYDVVLVGEQSRPRVAGGLDFGDLAPLDVAVTADTVIVPGADAPERQRSAHLLDALRAAHRNGARVASFCAGAFVLAQAGLLDGRRATTHWLLADDLRTAFPRVQVEPEHLYLDDDTVHTSGGVFAATDLSLHLLALDLGQDYANDLGRVLVTAPHRAGGQAPYLKESLRTGAGTHVRPLQSWLRAHLAEPLSLARLAEHAHMSERNLVRRFRSETGSSVFDWVAQERVSQAKTLLEETDHKIADIAAMVGLGTSESLRRNFERLVGTSARAYRAMFRPPRLVSGLPAAAPTPASVGEFEQDDGALAG